MAEASEERPAPSVMGTLAQRPLAHLIVYARNRRLSGTLELHAPDGRAGSMTLWRGRLTGARTTPPIAYLGPLAYELGKIDTETLDATLLELAKKERLHGEILVARGSMTALERDELLWEQVCRRVHHLFQLPHEATFAFYDARASIEEPLIQVDPIAPAWRGIRDFPPQESVLEVLTRFASAPLRLVNETPLSRSGFAPEELALCEALNRKALTISQLRTIATIPAIRVELLVYLLLIAKCIEPGTISSPALPETRDPAEPRRTSSGGMPAASRTPPPGVHRTPPPLITTKPMPTAGAGHASGPPPSIGASAGLPGGSTAPHAVTGPPSAPPSPSPRVTGPPSRGSIPTMPRTVLTPGLPHSPSGPPSSGRFDSGSGEMRRSLSFRVPSAPEMSVSTTARLAAQPSAVFGPADLGAAGIAARALGIDREDYFKSLGLPEGAPVEAARAAFFRLAKLWHSDRLPADLEPFRSEAEKIFAHMTKAHHTLTDPDLRREWLAHRAERASEKRERKDVMRDIETALGKREFQLAADEARRLVDADADDAEAMAIVAWASTNGGEDSEESLRAVIPTLDKAVNTDRSCERAYFYRGNFQKRLGNPAGAFRDFTRVVQLNPKHVDAQREIRIYEMRARKGSGEHALDALIKKKK